MEESQGLSTASNSSSTQYETPNILCQNCVVIILFTPRLQEHGNSLVEDLLNNFYFTQVNIEIEPKY